MIRRLLVANRGEIACRIFATCRAMGIETVAVASDADADAVHATEADRTVRLPGNIPADTYLRGDLLVTAAARSGADAVHPGYGFLAENADFAAAVTGAGLTWVGPPAAAIALMGAKIRAKELVAGAGVPVLVTHAEPAQVTAFPALVKASAGGGGRGMRVVRDAVELPAAVESARREASAAFGDGTVFIERYVERARHVEVQIFGDTGGTVVALGERECSIQRRHQKIIEEAPSPGVDADLRAALGAAAVAAGRAVGYVGAGTVEFLLTPEGEFFFLEMNTRLQVEHPVTECVSGRDLVRLQLLVAEGATLDVALPAARVGPAIPLARPEPPAPTPSAPAAGQAAGPAIPPGWGHAIEVRLCAEDPAAGWLPAAGTLHRFRIPGVAAACQVPGRWPGLRLDSGVRDGSVVATYYDSMLAKLVAWAPSRAEAIRLLATALTRAEIHGVVTNRDLLVQVLRHPGFQAGQIDTGFLDRHPEVFDPPLPPTAFRLHCLAAALAGAAARRAEAPVLGALPSGWRNVPSAPQTVGYRAPGGGRIEVAYRFDRAGGLATWSVRSTASDAAGPAGPAGEDSRAPAKGGGHVPAGKDSPAGGFPPVVRLVEARPDRVTFDVDGIRRVFRVHRAGDTSYVDDPDGSLTLTELPRFPAPTAELAEGSLVAPLPGAVGRVLVAPGQRVEAGALLLTLEAMKLEHPVHAPAAGVVAGLPVAPGTQVDTGTVLAVVTPSEPPSTPS